MKVARSEKLSLLKKIFMVDLIKGLMLTFSYQRPSANYTEQYPKVRPKVAERFRGAPRLNNDPGRGRPSALPVTSAPWRVRSIALRSVGSGLRRGRRR